MTETYVLAKAIVTLALEQILSFEAVDLVLGEL